jgi:hypothetical protein
LEAEYRVLDRDERITPKNKELIRRFLDFERLSKPDLKASSLEVFLLALLTIARLFPMDFDLSTKEDVEKVVSRIQAEGWSSNAYSTRLWVYKQFVKWMRTGSLEKTVPFPPEVAWVKTYFRKTQPRHFVTRLEIRRLHQRSNMAG